MALRHQNLHPGGWLLFFYEFKFKQISVTDVFSLICVSSYLRTLAGYAICSLFSHIIIIVQLLFTMRSICTHVTTSFQNLSTMESLALLPKGPTCSSSICMRHFLSLFFLLQSCLDPRNSLQSRRSRLNSTMSIWYVRILFSFILF